MAKKPSFPSLANALAGNTNNGVGDTNSSTLCVVGVEGGATFPAVYRPQGSRTDQNTAETSVSGALEPKPEVEIWRRPVFLTQRPRLAIKPKVGQSTQLLPV